MSAERSSAFPKGYTSEAATLHMGAWLRLGHRNAAYRQSDELVNARSSYCRLASHRFKGVEIEDIWIEPHMKFTSVLIDKKIMGVNVGMEISIGEYLRFARDIIKKNEYQRKRVSSHGKTYDLLRRDLLDGCVIPPIILAVTDAYGDTLRTLVSNVVQTGLAENTTAQLHSYIERAIAEHELVILDGLQRTNTLIDISSSASRGESSGSFEDALIRLEVYVGLSKTGILYRMLTLNTGQTPMSFRHQLEILYHDYIDRNDFPNSIEIFREADEKRARGIGKYKYQDVVDMFYAFSTGSPMPYDRLALVGQLREINFLEDFEYRPEVDDMRDLVIEHNHFVSHVNNKSGQWHLPKEDDDLGVDAISRPFGKSVPAIFEKPQAMAGFGAECKRLVSLKKIRDVGDIKDRISRTAFSDDPEIAFDGLLRILNDIASRSKKIGDSQRAYFQYAFRALLLEESDAYLDLSRCWISAKEMFDVLH